MYWVNFMREFYRTDAPAAAADTTTRVAGYPHRTAYSAKRPPAILGHTIIAASVMSTDEPADDAFHIERVQEDVLLLAQRLQTMQTALAVSDRGRSAFLSSMSHELRTPLNAIMGFSDMMKSGVFGDIDNPTYKQYVTHIHDSGALLLSKINDLLDIASMDADKLTLDEAECDLTEIFAELVEMHSHKAFDRQQTIHLDAAHGITLVADRSKLLCALSHFVTNALRHSTDGSGITIRARIQPDDGLILSVHDEGEGIADAQLRIIRDALQADIAYDHIECGGIGLGLSLSKELATRHGGRLMLDSMRRRGTVVAMILPLERIMTGMPKRRRPTERVSPLKTGEWQLV